MLLLIQRVAKKKKRWIRHNRCPISDRFCSSCLWSKCIFRSQSIDRKATSAIYESLILSICLYGCESWCLTEKLYSKLRQFHARCVRTMSHITLAQSRMYQIPTREIETELGLDSMWTNTSPAVNCDGLDMSAACPLIVCPDVCYLLGFHTRDQGVPRR